MVELLVLSVVVLVGVLLAREWRADARRRQTCVDAAVRQIGGNHNRE